jgi:heptose I phosphotransferase
MTPSVLTVPTPTTHPRPGLLARLLHGNRVVHAHADFAALAGDGWDDRVMGETVTDRFHAKQGRSIGRWTLEGAGRTLTVFLKRHHRLPRLVGWVAALFPGRAWSPGLQEWEHLAWAEAEGFPVPRPVAAGEFRGPWGRLQSFLAVEELAGMVPLNEAIPIALARLPAAAFARWKLGLIAEMARLARELHRRRAFHKDLYLCHFYLPAADCDREVSDFRGRVHMIDFHRLGRHRLGWAYFVVKDLAQLLYSTDGVAGITARDRVRFWRLYRAGEWGGVTTPPGWLGAVVMVKWRRYRRHNAKRRVKAGAGG